MLKIFNICNFYLLLWYVFQLKGWLYTQNVISVIALFAIYAISGYYVIEFIKSRRKPFFLRIYSFLFLVFCIYGIINIGFLGPVKTSWNVIPADFYLQKFLKSMLPLYAFYAFTKKGLITKEWLFNVSLISLIVAVARYNIGEEYALRMMLEKGVDREEVTNNAGYIFVALIPMLCFLQKKTIILYSSLGVCAFFILSAMKRGAILVGLLSYIFFFYKSLKNASSGKKISFLISISLFMMLGYVYVDYMMETSAYFDQRVTDTLEGNDSSRSRLYSDFGSQILNNGNVFTLLFGQGADATIRNGENYAHNDWLEIGMDIGLFGICCYLFFWKSFYSFWKHIRCNPTLSLVVGGCFIQLFSKTFFSMSINNIEISITCVLGYALATYENSKLEHEIENHEDTFYN